MLTFFRQVPTLVYKRSLQMALAIFIATLLAVQFNLVQGFWISITVLVVLQTTVGSTLRRAWQRIMGTLFGVILGSLIVMNLPFGKTYAALLLILLFVAFYLKAYALFNYIVFVIPLTAGIILLLGMMSPEKMPDLLPARIYDTLIGAFLALVVSISFLPSFRAKEDPQGLNKIKLALIQYWQDLILFAVERQEIKLGQDKEQLELALKNARDIAEELYYEYFFKKTKFRYYLSELRVLRDLCNMTFILNLRLREDLPFALKLRLKKILELSCLFLQDSDNTLLKANLKNSLNDFLEHSQEDLQWNFLMHFEQKLLQL